VALFGPSPKLSWSGDGGQSWQPARVPAGLRPTAVTWPFTGPAVAAAQERGGVRLLISADGGRSWQPGPGWPGEAGAHLLAAPHPQGGLVVFLASREGTTVWMARLLIQAIPASR